MRDMLRDVRFSHGEVNFIPCVVCFFSCVQLPTHTIFIVLMRLCDLAMRATHVSTGADAEEGDQAAAATPPAAAAAALLSRVAAEAPSLCAGLHAGLQGALLRHDHTSQWVATRVLAACGVPENDAEEQAPLAVVQRLLEIAAGGAAACSHPKAATFAVNALVKMLGEGDAAHRVRCDAFGWQQK